MKNIKDVIGKGSSKLLQSHLIQRIIDFVFSFSIMIVAYLLIIKLIQLLTKTSLSFDDSDKQNLVQIALLAGLFATVREAIANRQEAVKLRESEETPILTMHIRTVDINELKKHGLDGWDFYNIGENIYKYIVIRNTGKGTALNLKVNPIDNRNMEFAEFKNYVIAPGSDEVAIKLKNKPVDQKELNGVQYKIETETISGKKWFYRSEIRDVEKNYIMFVKMTDKEGELMKNNI
ncbi:hypothetical protein JW796_01165 [Candidatus Dojkabacteria bacterium]|nr:hypothetical protein [Candidatus Dojkabacteria bacterium]